MTAPSSSPRLSVVVLAYNEVRNLPAACEELLGTLRGLGESFELLIIDDGSSDGTSALADDLAAQHPEIRVLHHPQNLGLGGGYRSGFNHARGEYLTFFPADGQFPASIIPDFLAHMARADMVLGYIPNRRSSLVAKGLSFAERVLYRAMFGKMPKFQGIMMFRRAILAQLPLVSTGRGWAVVMELILRTARGPYRVVSVPNALRPRMSGESKVNNLRTIRSNLRQMFTLYRQL